MYLKVTLYKYTDIESWQLLSVVGESVEEVRQRTERAFDPFDDEDVELECKSYPLVQVSNEAADQIQNGDNDTAKRLAIEAVDNLNPETVHNPDQFTFTEVN